MIDILFAILIIIFFYIIFRRDRTIELENTVESMIDKKYHYNDKIYGIQKL